MNPRDWECDVFDCGQELVTQRKKRFTFMAIILEIRRWCPTELIVTLSIHLERHLLFSVQPFFHSLSSDSICIS
jgi:hypothetical protein